MSRSLWYLGLLLVVGGVTLSVVPTGSYSTIAGDRPVSVSVASDDEAFLALTETGSTVSDPGGNGNGGTVVASLVNNLDSDITVSYEASADTDSVTLRTTSETTAIAEGDQERLYASCDPPNGGSGTATLTVTVSEATGDGATITDAVLRARFPYDCPGGPPGGDPPGPPDGVAYVDANENGAYDDGETTLTESEVLRFDDADAHLVVDSDGDRISSNREIAIEAENVVVRGTTFRSNRGISVGASDAVEFVDAGVDARNGDVEIVGSSVAASRTTFETNREVNIEAERGDANLAASTVAAKNGKVEVKGSAVDAQNTQLSSNREILLTAESGAVGLSGATVDSKNGEIEVSGDGIGANDAEIATNREISLDAGDGEMTLVGATVDSKNGELELTGRSVDARNAEIATNREISVTATDGAIDLTGSTVRSKNGEITVAAAGRLDAAGATIETNVDVTLESDGDLVLDGATLSTRNGALAADLGRDSATLSVDGAAIRGRDGTLVYSPSGVTVSGTPDEGTVRSD